MRVRGAERLIANNLGAAALGIALLGCCSTVDRGPGEQCQEDIDCGVGWVCSLAQSNTCVPEEPPPQAAVGFEIKDGNLRIELMGCDPEVTRELGGTELRVQRRSRLINDYAIRATTRRSVVNCGGDECGGVCDETALTCSEPTSSGLELSMSSRLGLADLSDKQNFEVPDPLPESGLAPAAKFTWPTYESADPRAHSALVLEVTPTAEPNQSSFRRVLAEDAPAEVDAIGTLRCQRGLYRLEGGVSTVSGVPVGEATIDFRYAESIATPSTVIGTAAACVEDEDCPPGWACNGETCGLDLTDITAGSTTSSSEEAGAFPPAWVYTYCEETVEQLSRKFTVTVTPPAQTGLPTVLYALDQEFIDPWSVDAPRHVELDNKLCLPDWQPPQTVSVAFSGEPVELTETELGAYRCCSTECLPSNEPDVEPVPPPSLDSCSGFERARFETRWFNSKPDQWAFAECLEPTVYPDGSNGRYRSDVECEDGQCSVALTAGAVEDMSRVYTMTLTQRAGSVFQSQRVTVQINSETTELPTFELLPRVLLRGQVTCASEKCSATDAVVLVERLRVDTDDSDLPGPFYFEAEVDLEGKFVVPVDPGVYVITAFPAVGQPGGPARFKVVDLREGSDLVEMVDGVPNATLPGAIELEDGVLVRVVLDDFEVPTNLTPLDIGSWKAQSDFPADEFDLNDPQTCYATDGSGKSARRGCAVRRLAPAPISMLASQRVQFTARNRGGNSCE